MNKQPIVFPFKTFKPLFLTLWRVIQQSGSWGGIWWQRGLINLFLCWMLVGCFPLSPLNHDAGLDSISFNLVMERSVSSSRPRSRQLQGSPTLCKMRNILFPVIWVMKQITCDTDERDSKFKCREVWPYVTQPLDTGSSAVAEALAGSREAAPRALSRQNRRTSLQGCPLTGSPVWIQYTKVPRILPANRSVLPCNEWHTPCSPKPSISLFGFVFTSC